MASGFLTYSLSVPIELTRLCASACEFCPYPFTRREPLLSQRKVEKAIAEAERLGATALDFTAGDRAGDMPEIIRACHYYGYASFRDYLIDAAQLAHEPYGRRPLPARLDVGPLEPTDWRILRRHFLCARLLLTCVDPSVSDNGALKKASTQRPVDRLQSIIEAGKAGMPLTTGVMVGIGESVASRHKALHVLTQVAGQYGHIQSVAIQAFRPHPATPMASHPPTPLSDVLDCVSLARRLLPPTVRVQINALDWRQHLQTLVEAGANDLGDLHVKLLSQNDRDAKTELSLLFEPLEKQGFVLRGRGVLMPSHAHMPDAPKRLRSLLQAISSA
jgi:FO synthase